MPKSATQLLEDLGEKNAMTLMNRLPEQVHYEFVATRLHGNLGRFLKEHPAAYQAIRQQLPPELQGQISAYVSLDHANRATTPTVEHTAGLQPRDVTLGGLLRALWRFIFPPRQESIIVGAAIDLLFALTAPPAPQPPFRVAIQSACSQIRTHPHIVLGGLAVVAPDLVTTYYSRDNLKRYARDDFYAIPTKTIDTVADSAARLTEAYKHSDRSTEKQMHFRNAVIGLFDTLCLPDSPRLPRLLDERLIHRVELS